MLVPDLVRIYADKIASGQIPKPNVAIGIPYYRVAEVPMLMACMSMCILSARLINMMPITSSGAYVETNRNGIVRYAKQTGVPFDYLLWIDTDMQFPADALFRLLAHDKDIVGANYRTRTAPFRHAGHYLDGTDENVGAYGLVPMSHLPTGLLLTKFDIYNKLPEPHFRAPRDEGEPRDDVYFCGLAREHGYEVWCDQDLTREVYHRTVQDLGWFDSNQLIIVAGAELNVADEEKRAAERAALSAKQYKSMASAA